MHEQADAYLAYQRSHPEGLQELVRALGDFFLDYRKRALRDRLPGSGREADESLEETGEVEETSASVLGTARSRVLSHFKDEPR